MWSHTSSPPYYFHGMDRENCTFFFTFLHTAWNREPVERLTANWNRKYLLFLNPLTPNYL
jgi:hypothetical protein